MPISRRCICPEISLATEEILNGNALVYWLFIQWICKSSKKGDFAISRMSKIIIPSIGLTSSLYTPKIHGHSAIWNQRWLVKISLQVFFYSRHYFSRAFQEIDRAMTLSACRSTWCQLSPSRCGTVWKRSSPLPHVNTSRSTLFVSISNPCLQLRVSVDTSFLMTRKLEGNMSWVIASQSPLFLSQAMPQRKCKPWPRFSSLSFAIFCWWWSKIIAIKPRKLRDVHLMAPKSRRYL